MSKLELKARIDRTYNAPSSRTLIQVSSNGTPAGALVVDAEHAAEVVRILNGATEWWGALEGLIMSASDRGCEDCGISRAVEVRPSAMDHARKVFAKSEATP